jgi:hypothetical protein
LALAKPPSSEDLVKVENEQTKFESGAVRSSCAANFRYDLISPIGLEAVAAACREGAEKYGDCNWEKGMPISDLLNHAVRHIYMYLAGYREEDHLGHAAWGLMAAIHSSVMWPELNRDFFARPGCVKNHVELVPTPASSSEFECPYECDNPTFCPDLDLCVLDTLHEAMDRWAVENCDLLGDLEVALSIEVDDLDRALYVKLIDSTAKYMGKSASYKALPAEVKMHVGSDTVDELADYIGTTLITDLQACIRFEGICAHRQTLDFPRV